MPRMRDRVSKEEGERSEEIAQLPSVAHTQFIDSHLF